MERESIARWVSILGHPFVLVLFYVVAAVSAFLPWQQAALATAIVFFVAILPMTAYLQKQVKKGRTNFDVSAQELRGPIYGLGLFLGSLQAPALRRAATGLVLAGAVVLGFALGLCFAWTFASAWAAASRSRVTTRCQSS